MFASCLLPSPSESFKHQPLFLFIFHIFFRTIHSFIHPFAEGPLFLFPHCSSLSRGSPWGAEPGFELGPAVQLAYALLSELHRTHKKQVTSLHILNFDRYFQTRIIYAQTKLYLETISFISSLISKEESFLFKIKGIKHPLLEKHLLLCNFFSFFLFD